MPISSEFTQIRKSNGGHPHGQPPSSLDITFYIYSVILLFLLRVIHDKLTIAREALGTDVEMLGMRVIVECD